MSNIKSIVIDAGHGGEDPGTIKNGITEKDYTLLISKYMKKRFDELGIKSTLTRDSDITLNPTDRAKKVKSIYGDTNDVLVISNHINSGGGDGAEIIYALRNNDNLSKKIYDSFLEAGQNVRKYYQRRLPSNPSKDYYYILRDTANNESVIVEYGFADSPLDDVNQIKNDYEKLTEAVVKAVANYIGVSYKKPTTSSNIYIVKKGDTLYSIASKYNTTVDNIKNINNLSTTILSIGQQLIIPNGNQLKDTYTVLKGDTLWSIANKFNMSVNELKAINNLSTNLLSIGQVLKLKNDNTNNNMKYIVKKGDTLYKIARDNNTTVTKLIELNNLSTTNLKIGQELLIK